MKSRSFFVLVFFTLVFVACSLDSESNSRPGIFMNSPVVYSSSKMDTLGYKYDSENDITVLDTIQVGDTVQFQMYITGYTNNLKTLQIKQSADSVTRIITPSKARLDSLFTSSSNYSQLRFTMPGTYVALYFPFKYVARQASKEAKLELAVTSDASSDYCNAALSLRTPIKAAKQK